MAIAACCAISPARAQIVTNTFSYNLNLTIPDNDLSGASDTETVSSPITDITGIQVTLDISSGYNGDLYAYLTHGSTGFAVLLNRVGRTTSNNLGYANSGFQITFNDAAANGDIHDYGLVTNVAGGTLTGVWQPDGRNIFPTNSLATTPRTAMLGSLTNQDANGDWTLFVADVSPGSTATLDSWGVTITGTAVPEPGAETLGAVGLLMLLLRKHFFPAKKSFAFAPSAAARVRAIGATPFPTWRCEQVDS